MKRDLPHVVRMAQIQARTDDQLKSQLFSHLRKLSEFQTNEEKLSWVHSEVERLLSDSTKETRCLKGCHYCCFHPIALSSLEMEEIAKLASSPNLDRLQKQKNFFQNHRPIEYEARACVYLVDGECSVYEKRPLICRLTHVSSAPENCHFENEEKPIEHLPVTQAALVVGAFYMAHPDVELLPLLVNED